MIRKIFIFICIFIIAVVIFIAVTGILTYFPNNRLEKVLIDGHLAGNNELQAVQIIREDRIINTRLDMKLKDGDKINIGDKTSVVVILRGTEVILDSNTYIRIDESSHCIFNQRGKVFIKGSWSIKTKYLKAGVEGTQYIVTVKPDDIVEVVVLEGVVNLKSFLGVTRIERLKQLIVEGQGLPSKVDFEKKVIENIRQWINSIKQILRKKILFFYWFYEIDIRKDFNRIIWEQTYYFIDHDRYADDLSKLHIDLSPGVSIEIVNATNMIFEVKATHDKLPGYLWTMTHPR